MAEVIHNLPDQRVGRIAAQLPGASAVFRRLGIDFCCQGHALLKDAVSHRNLDLAEVERTLEALDPAAAPQVPSETGALIDHIQTRYHDVHRQQIPELAELSQRVESVHVNHPQVPAGLAETLRQARGELEVHMKKEELMLFPVMRRQAAIRLAEPLREMRHDHNDHAMLLDQIKRLTDNCTPPADACGSWRALYTGVAQFQTDLMEHIHLENNILFPRFEAADRD